MSEKKAQPKIFRGGLNDEELVEHLSNVVEKIKIRNISKDSAPKLRARAEEADKKLAELNEFIYQHCYAKEPEAIPECEKLESGDGINNDKKSKVKFFNHHNKKGPLWEDGFLRNRAAIELAATLCQSLLEWCEEEGVATIKLKDLDAVHGLMKIMITREKGGKFSPPNY